jgi:hypothetical protein
VQQRTSDEPTGENDGRAEMNHEKEGPFASEMPQKRHVISACRICRQGCTPKGICEELSEPHAPRRTDFLKWKTRSSVLY